MHKYKLIIEYDGNNFVGWQRQDNGISIQSSIEKAIKKLSNEELTLIVVNYYLHLISINNIC